LAKLNGCAQRSCAATPGTSTPCNFWGCCTRSAGIWRPPASIWIGPWAWTPGAPSCIFFGLGLFEQAADGYRQALAIRPDMV
jgi:hypothetical protein